MRETHPHDGVIPHLLALTAAAVAVRSSVIILFYVLCDSFRDRNVRNWVFISTESFQWAAVRLEFKTGFLKTRQGRIYH